ncbi:MAG: Threonine-phosphate decarboxylase [Nitrospira sp.]
MLVHEKERLMRHYPDPDCGSLRRALASRWRLSPLHFVIGNGSTELIHLLPRVLCIRSALVVGPTFSEYGAALNLADAKVHVVWARRRDGYRPPLDKAARWIWAAGRRDRASSAVFLCNPNSPTGQACESDELAEFVGRIDQSGAWLILDETFTEYCEGLSLLPMLQRYPRLIVLRSFTKFYALPGLRIGYSVCAPSIAETVRRHQPPWSVNSFAQAAAETAMNDRRYVRRSLAYMEEERKRFSTLLAGIPRLRVFPSRANFLLLELPDRAHSATEALKRRGILVRDCSRVPGLTSRSIRVAVRTRPENDRMVSTLRQLLRGMP